MTGMAYCLSLGVLLVATADDKQERSTISVSGTGKVSAAPDVAEISVGVVTQAGFTNLIDSQIGADAYSYLFDGQWGYLDYAFASPALLAQVTGVGEYHINADEPSVLDYNTDFKTPNLITSLYAPDQFRVSDHDPVVVGLSLTKSADFFLRGSGATANPATVFLQTTAPTGTLTSVVKTCSVPPRMTVTRSGATNAPGAPFGPRITRPATPSFTVPTRSVR